MKILSLATDGNQTILITQAHSSGGGQYGNPVVLSTVRCASADLMPVIDHLNAKGHRFPKDFEVLERWPVDSRNRGPKSRYGKTLALMREELGDHLAGNITVAANDDENAVAFFVAAALQKSSEVAA
mgnify:CR=1 FL=1